MIDLKFDRVSKKYRIEREFNGAATRLSTRDRLRSLRRRHEDFWALKNVSFEVSRGETLGIIGPNGAGKSTILKLLSKITAPTSGEIVINGRLSALIEVGSGFHPELTGRENVYLSGSILGMSRREIANKMDSIVDFAGVRQFIDTPVKRYSSGMYVRLGFSIAAHLHPDILLLDEVLAVGDAAFQARCYERINDLKDSGTTIVFISHDLSAVSRICNRALLVLGGEIVGTGSPREVISEYQRLSAEYAPPDVVTSDEAEINSVSLLNSAGCEGTVFHTGNPLNIHVEFTAHEKLEDAVFEVFAHSKNWDQYCHLTSGVSDELIDLDEGQGAIDFSCAELGLQAGTYFLSAAIIRRGQLPGSGVDWRPECAMFVVEPGKLVRGNFYMPYRWQVNYTRGGSRMVNGQDSRLGLDAWRPGYGHISFGQSGVLPPSDKKEESTIGHEMS
jgi:ABC-type polysaccharide/polyol phosphate transport system ATPase subunit